MSTNYRTDRILVKASELQPGDVDRLNKIMENAGYGCPLQPETGAPAAGASGLVGLRVAGADPMTIRDLARPFARQHGGELPVVALDHHLNAGTLDTALWASGKKSGHGTGDMLPAPEEQVPKWPEWRRLDRRPVIALLDCEVQGHVRLPDPADGQAFIVAADKYGWDPPILSFDLGPHHGGRFSHATFIAGLIRREAPDAQILSIQVMSSFGRVETCDVHRALTWLESKPEVRGSVNIVLMCFGRQIETDDSDLHLLREPIEVLSAAGVQFVASAGNDGSESPVYPAAFATDPFLRVVSVGGLVSLTERAPGSNYGPWVQEWRKGFNVASITPLVPEGPQIGFGPFPQDNTGAGYAWWSGTSFAAAIYAGERARQLQQPGPALPDPATGP